MARAAVVAPLAVIAGGVLAWRRRWPELAVLVGAMLIILIAVPALKDMIDRPRPAGGLVEASGSSYPSGHAAYAVFYAWVALTSRCGCGRGGATGRR